MVSLNPAVTGQGRTFINTEGAGCGHGYAYLGCYKIDSLEQSLGEITSIYCPSQDQYDAFVEVASIRGADSRWTSTIIGTLPVDTETELERVRRNGCSFNLQVHFGSCDRPDDFGSFISALILQDVRLTNYSLSSLTALSPDERAAVSETASFSASNAYRIFDLEFNQTATGVLTTGAPIGIVVCDSVRCGTVCDAVGTSDGCQAVYSVYVDAGNPTRMLFSVDGGISWDARPIDNVNNPAAVGLLTSDALTCAGNDLWFSIQDTVNSEIYVVDPVGVEFTANNFVATLVFTTPADILVRDLDLGTNSIWGVGTNEVGGTYIIAIDKATNTTTIIDSGNISNIFDLTSVHALSDSVVLAGARTGQVVFSSTEGAFSVEQISVNGVNVTDDVIDVHLISTTDWLAATADAIYCTGNRGITWTQVLSNNSGGRFTFFDNITGYYENNESIYRTLDSGNTWDVVSASNGFQITGNHICPTNPNVYYSAGTVISKGAIA